MWEAIVGPCPGIWDFFPFWVCFLVLEPHGGWQQECCAAECCARVSWLQQVLCSFVLGWFKPPGWHLYEQSQNCHLPSRWDVPYHRVKGMELSGSRSLALWWEQIPLLNNSKGQEILWLTWDQENSGLSTSFMLCRMNGSLPSVCSYHDRAKQHEHRVQELKWNWMHFNGDQQIIIF